MTTPCEPVLLVFALLAVTPLRLGASLQQPGFSEEIVPSEEAKRAYELCAAEGQPADQALERCSAALGYGLSGRVAGRVHTLIGWAYWTLGQPGPAADAWLAATRFEPKDAMLRFGTGVFLEAAGRSEEAEGAFREAVRAGLRADNEGLPGFLVGYGRGQIFLENYAYLLERLAVALDEEGLATEAHQASVAACGAYQEAPGKASEALACRRRLIPHGAGEARGHLELARSLENEPRYGAEEAIASFREAIRLDPTLAPAHLGLAQILEKQKEPEAALTSYREALRLDPSLDEAREAVASLEALGFGQPDAAAAAGRPDTPEALAELRQCIDYGHGGACRRALAIGLSPLQSARAWTFLGIALEEAAEVEGGERAEKAYREALAARPDYALAYYCLGRILTIDRPHEATAALESALRLRPDWDAARELQARSFAQDGRWDEVVKVQEQILRSRPNDAGAARDLADALINAGRGAEAIPYLEIVAQSPITTMRSWVQLGQELQKSSRPAEARSAFLEALDAPVEPDNPDHQRVVRSWVLNGLDALGQVEDAIAARRRWLATDPDLQPAALTKKLIDRAAWSEGRWYISLHVELASALEQLGRRAEAERAENAMLAPYRAAVTQAPSRPDLHVELAESLARVGRPDEAIAQAREAVRLEPGEATWQRSLVQRLEAAGRLEEALEAASRRRELEPTSDEALRSVAVILLKLHRDEEALDFLRRASENAEQKAAIVGMIVSALESLGRAEESLPWWRQWLESGPGRRLPWGAPGRTKETARAAAESYRQAVLRDPADPVPECALGLTLSWSLGVAEEGLAAVRRCAAKGSREAWAQATLGLQLSDAGERRQAIEAIETAERLEPGFLESRSYDYQATLERSRSELQKEATQP